MSQSTLITGLLIAAFILYLAAKNRLTVYESVLWGNTSAPLPTPPSTAPAGGSPTMGGSGGNSSTLDEAAEAAELAGAI